MEPQPLRISWNLTSAWSPTQMGLHLDGLLAYALVQLRMREAGEADDPVEETGFERAPLDYASVLADLPLEKHFASSSSSTNANVDAWCWKASLLRPVQILASSRRHMTAKTPIVALADYANEARDIRTAYGDRIKSEPLLDPVRGAARSGSFFVEAQHVATVRAYCIGDPDRIASLLQEVSSIGRRGRLGFGMIESDENGLPIFDVSIDEEAHTMWADRVMPEAIKGPIAYVPHASRLRPPYWEGAGQVMCWRPAV